MFEREPAEISPEDFARFFDAFVPTLVVMMLVIIIGLGALMFWGILRKAGRPGWRSLIPVYQWGQVCEIAGKPAWWGWIVGISQLLPVVLMGFIFGSMKELILTETPITTLPASFQWFGVLWLTGIVGFVLQILIAVAVARAFGQSDAWAIGLVLLPYIFYPIIGLGSSAYVGPGPHQPVSRQSLPPLPPPYPVPPPPQPPPPLQ